MYEQVTASEFKSTLNQMPSNLSAFLSEYTAREYTDIGATCYLSQDKQSGYAIKPDGELISVFSLPGSRQGVAAVKSAVENGATKLDCLGEFLVTLYRKFGFVEYARDAWNDQYAPKNWDYGKFGKPDIIYMQRE